MKKIIYQAHWKLETLVYLCHPVFLRTNIYEFMVCFHRANHRQSRKRGSPKRQSRSSSRKVSNDLESDPVVSASQIRCDITGVIIPEEGATARWPNRDANPIDIELVSSIGREVADGVRGLSGESELAGKIDDPTGCICVGGGGVDPVRGPDPVGLEVVDCLAAALATDDTDRGETSRTCCS